MPNLSSTTPYYGGGQVENPADVITTSGPPSTQLTNLGLGTLAVDNSLAEIYALVSKSGGTATWSKLGGSGLSIVGAGATGNMVSGSVTINNSEAKSDSIIIYCLRTQSGSTGTIDIGGQADGSFSLTSTSINETSDFYYIIIS